MSTPKYGFSANQAFATLLVVFSLSLVGLVTLLIKTLPLTVAHIIYVCQRSFSSTTSVISHSVLFGLALVAVFIFFIGLLAAGIQVLKTRLHIKRTAKRFIKTPKLVKDILIDLRLDGRVKIVQDNARLSFCCGLLKPDIYLSTGLIKNLSHDELKTVLLHERYHLRNHDPLKIVVAKAASTMFFFIPLIREIQSYYIFSKEIAADETAIRNSQKEPLLSALSKLITLNDSRLGAIAAFATVDNLEKRVKYLTQSQPKILFKPSLISLTFSSLVVVVSFMLFNAPVNAMDEQTMNNSYFLCAYGNSCTSECKTQLKKKEINFSESKLYSPTQPMSK